MIGSSVEEPACWVGSRLTWQCRVWLAPELVGVLWLFRGASAGAHRPLGDLRAPRASGREKWSTTSYDRDVAVKVFVVAVVGGRAWQCRAWLTAWSTDWPWLF